MGRGGLVAPKTREKLWHGTFKRKFMCRGARYRGVWLRLKLKCLPARTWDHQTLTLVRLVDLVGHLRRLNWLYLRPLKYRVV